MKKTKRGPPPGSFVLVMLVSAFLMGQDSGGCGGSDEEGSLTSQEITLYNDSLGTYHLWMQGDSMGSHNKVSPGGGRVVRASIDRKKDSFTRSFFAGRNGKQDYGVSCSFRIKSIVTIDYWVTWNGDDMYCYQSSR